MNQDEKLVGDWLVRRSHKVRHLENGEDPPDLVVDGNIAVEVTTIASYAFSRVWDFMESICKSLGAAENGRGYWIEVASDDEALLQGEDRKRVAKVKRDLRRSAKIALRDHYANPGAALRGPASLDCEEQIDFFLRDGRIRLPHGVEVGIVGPINNNRDDVKYKVGMGGGTEGILVVPHLIEAIQSAIHKKADNRIIKERAGQHREWWLVVTDPHYARGLNDDETRTVANAIDYGEPWRRILLAIILEDRIARVVDLSESRQNAGTTDAA